PRRWVRAGAPAATALAAAGRPGSRSAARAGDHSADRAGALRRRVARPAAHLLPPRLWDRRRDRPADLLTEDRPLGSEVGLQGPCGSRSEEHTSELQSRFDLVCRLLLENITHH